MKRYRYDHSHAAVFLMEILLAILCFSLASAVCLRLFVYARQLSDRSGDVSFAVGQVSSVAALLEQAQTPEAALTLLQTQYPDSQAGQIYYDAHHTLCQKAQAAYTLTVTGDEQRLCLWQLVFSSLEESPPLYELTLEVYYGA